MKMLKNKVAVVIQCRLSSTRLKEKALKDLGGKTVLEWVLCSMKKVRADKYYVATDEQSFPYLKDICKKNDYEIFAGDLNNVLKRFCDLIRIIKVNTIVRATADNPFLFYEAAQESLDDYLKRIKKGKQCDYLTYTGLPHGCGVEIINADSLLLAEKQTDSPYDREHVGPSLYNHQDKFVCEFIKAPEKYYFPQLRTTIDTYSDYLKAIRVIKYLNKEKFTKPLTTEEILQAEQSEFVSNPVVYVPSVTKGHGTGHLHRCLKAALEGKDFVYIQEDCSLLEAKQIIQQYKEIGLEDYQIITELPNQDFNPVIVTDLFQMEKQNVKVFSDYRTVISIDEGSKYAQYSDYLLDILPSVEENRKVNLFDTSFISKPDKTRNSDNESIKNILVCFGGEDPSNLTLKTCNILVNIFSDVKIDAVYSKEIFQKINNVNFIKPIKNLKNELYKYDIVITHFGLTAFEALYAKCNIILASTTKLHEQLAKKFKFNFIPFEKLDFEHLKNAVNSINEFKPEFKDEKNELFEYIKTLSAGKRLLCPICYNRDYGKDIIVERTLTKTYRRCKNCNLIYLSWSAEKDKEYSKQYFFDDYKKQYGKTYKEDFESIKKNCLKRAANIKKISSRNNKNVLDIGCAYGPFLKAAEETGFIPYGTDISDDAIYYVKNELRFPSCVSAFPKINVTKEFGISEFDVVTMWYVIEHFKNLGEVLTKVNSLTKKNGIFAFSTPSAQGVSGKRNKYNFYTQSPSDHFSVWEPSKANIVLKKYGFKIKKIVSTGHHPERFPYIKKHNCKKNGLIWKWCNLISHIFKLGDTVEIYCKKIKNF